MSGSSDTSAAPSPSAPTAGSPPPATPPPKRVVRRSGRRGLYAAAAVVVLVVILAGVGYGTHWYGLASTKSSAPGACPILSTPLQGDGAQIVAPLLGTSGAWVTAYHTQSGNEVNYPASGSGTGLSHFTAGSLDFAVTDDPLTSTERGALPAQPLTLPFIGGALTIIYNLPGVTGHLNLTGNLLAEIYNGTITTWDNSAIEAINPGVTLPSNTILTVHRSDAAGTTYVLSDFLSQSNAWWAANVGKGISISFPDYSGVPDQTAEKGNSLMISTVTSNDYSIGYSDLTDVLSAATPPQYAAIENPAGHFIVPTIADTISAISDKVSTLVKIPASTGDWFNVSMVNANGTSDYPIATFIYMFVYQATDKGFTPTLEKSEVLVQWLHFTLSAEAQALADESTPTQLYYAPLPSTILSVDQTGIQTMTYNGTAIPACT